MLGVKVDTFHAHVVVPLLQCDSRRVSLTSADLTERALEHGGIARRGTGSAESNSKLLFFRRRLVGYASD